MLVTLLTWITSLTLILPMPYVVVGMSKVSSCLLALCLDDIKWFRELLLLVPIQMHFIHFGKKKILWSKEFKHNL